MIIQPLVIECLIFAHPRFKSLDRGELGFADDGLPASE
jgi:hypothetical protein